MIVVDEMSTTETLRQRGCGRGRSGNISSTETTRMESRQQFQGEFALNNNNNEKFKFNQKKPPQAHHKKKKNNKLFCCFKLPNPTVKQQQQPRSTTNDYLLLAQQKKRKNEIYLKKAIEVKEDDYNIIPRAEAAKQRYPKSFIVTKKSAQSPRHETDCNKVFQSKTEYNSRGQTIMTA